jgi:peptidyl-prolyl cis-trans isomerase A (cyclophilin A)
LAGREVRLRVFLAFSAFLASLVLLPACSRTSQSPPTFRVQFDTSQGPFVIEVHRDWSPQGADRFYDLIHKGFYDENRFFRVVPNFVIQWGIQGDPAVQLKWRDKNIPDDPVKVTNRRGTIAYATGGPNTRTTQLFINLKDNPQLDKRGFSPFGEVVSGMNVVDGIYPGYGQTPDQDQIQLHGNAYLQKQFPQLDYIKTARVAQ